MRLCPWWDTCDRGAVPDHLHVWVKAQIWDSDERDAVNWSLVELSRVLEAELFSYFHPWNLVNSIWKLRIIWTRRQNEIVQNHGLQLIPKSLVFLLWNLTYRKDWCVRATACVTDAVFDADPSRLVVFGESILLVEVLFSHEYLLWWHFVNLIIIWERPAVVARAQI